MKSNHFRKLGIALLVLIAVLCMLSFSTAETQIECTPIEKFDDYYEQYECIYIETSLGETIHEDEKGFATHFENITSDDHMQADKTISRTWQWSGGVKLKAEMKSILGLAGLDIEANFEGGHEWSNTDHIGLEVHLHRKITIYEAPCTVKVQQTVTINQKRAPLSAPDAWETISTQTESGIKTGTSRALIAKETSSRHIEDESTPRKRNTFNGMYTHYYCKVPGCPKPNGEVEFEIDKSHTCEYSESICVANRSCIHCGKYDRKSGHDYDYSNPKSISEDSDAVRFKCKNCDDFELHCHTFKATSAPLKPQDEYLITTYDPDNHKRLYMEERKCTYLPCSIIRDFPKWKAEPHTTWTTLDKKEATCYQDGHEDVTCDACSFEKTIIIPATENHVYDYDNPIPTAYSVIRYQCIAAPGCPYYYEHVHKYSSDGPKPTNETREIPGDYSKHKRKYVECLECNGGEHCNEKTKTIETWPEETHSWCNEIRIEATCFKDGSVTHICAGCDMVEEYPVFAPRNHDPDYDHPIRYSDDEIRYPCKRPGCNEIAEFHFHTFKDTGLKTATKEYMEITGDNKNHKRKYMVQRQCNNGDHCNELRDFPKWEVESHGNNWHNEITKPATCLVNGSRTRMCALCDYVDTTVLTARGKHVYDYDHPKKVDDDTVKYLCDNKNCTAYETHKHSYKDTGEKEATKSYSEIINNTTHHKRLYKVSQQCTGAHCSQKQIIPKWINEKHSFVQKGETHGNCVTPAIKGYQCSKCSMTKTENGNKDPKNHASLSKTYKTVTSPTCTKTGSGYYSCSACGGKVTVTLKATGHSWDSGKIVVYPTISMPGQKRYTCTKCGATETRSYK